MALTVRQNALRLGIAGARGESAADIARRTGIAATDATDAEAVIALAVAATQELIEQGEITGAVATPFASGLLAEATASAWKEELLLTGAVSDGAVTAFGDGARQGGTRGAAYGDHAGADADGDYVYYAGAYAGAGSNANFSTFIGAVAGENAVGDRVVVIGPIAGRDHHGSGAVLAGFAAGENVDGDRHIFLGDHAGPPPYIERILTNPSMDGNVLTSDPPEYDGNPITLVIGRRYRLQFDDGSGTAPSPLHAVSTIAEVLSVGATVEWEIVSADVTTAGSGGWQVGLCYYDWDDEIVIGDGSPDGPNQVRFGFENSREFLPPNDGLTSLGRSPSEAETYGARGLQRWRGVAARYAGLWADEAEPAFQDFGRWDGSDWIRRWSLEYSTTGELIVNRYDATGAKVGEPWQLDPVWGCVKMPNQIAGAMLAAADTVDVTASSFTVVDGSIAGWSMAPAALGVHLNSTSGLFTAPVAGRYRARFQLGTSGSNAGQGQISLGLNGSAGGSVADMYGPLASVSVEWIFQMAAGETLCGMVKATSGTLALRNNGIGSFTVDLIG